MTRRTTTLLLLMAFVAPTTTIHAANLGVAHAAAQREVHLTSLPVMCFLIGLFTGLVAFAVFMHYCVWKPRHERRRNEWSLEGISNDQKTVLGEEDDDDNDDIGNEGRRNLELVITRSPPVPSLPPLSIATARRSRPSVATGTPISEIHRQNPHQSEASASFTVASGDTAMTHDFVDTIGAGEGNSAQQEDRHQVQNIHDFSDVEAANQSNHGIKDTKDNQTGRDVTQVGQTHCIGGNKV